MFASESLKDRSVAQAMPTNAVGGSHGGRKVVLSRAKSALRFIQLVLRRSSEKSIGLAMHAFSDDLFASFSVCLLVRV